MAISNQDASFNNEINRLVDKYINDLPTHPEVGDRKLLVNLHAHAHILGLIIAQWQPKDRGAVLSQAMQYALMSISEHDRRNA